MSNIFITVDIIPVFERGSTSYSLVKAHITDIGTARLCDKRKESGCVNGIAIADIQYLKRRLAKDRMNSIC